METANEEDHEMATTGNEHTETKTATPHRFDQVPAELFQYVLDELGARNSGMWL
jgi:hypothetical protein